MYKRRSRESASEEKRSSFYRVYACLTADAHHNAHENGARKILSRTSQSARFRCDVLYTQNCTVLCTVTFQFHLIRPEVKYTSIHANQIAHKNKTAN